VAGMTDVMVDLETTGLVSDSTGIIQIAMIKFNYDTGEIGEVFDRCLSIAPNRYWDESTRTWWMGKNRKVYDQIVARMEPPEQVIKDMIQYTWRDAPNGGYRFWSKPTHFDFPLIESYCRQYGQKMPFHFRTARDLNTFIAARAGVVTHVEMDHIEFAGDEHNALADCVHQLKMLFAARDGDFGRRVEDVVDAEFTEIAA
jgi:hypothetical protein